MPGTPGARGERGIVETMESWEVGANVVDGAARVNHHEAERACGESDLTKKHLTERGVRQGMVTLRSLPSAGVGFKVL